MLGPQVASVLLLGNVQKILSQSLDWSVAVSGGTGRALRRQCWQ